ncbi:MAG TPA: hypothetical protein VM910_13175 [Bradyrhizobium sp.]|nr:hypothetical protein [Bradyrhizobium sp.]
MRKISLVGVAAALILAGVGSWVGSTTLGGAVIGWSGVSIAEEANGPRRLGVLMRIAEDDPSAQTDFKRSSVDWKSWDGRPAAMS